jgi:hypothetical protein
MTDNRHFYRAPGFGRGSPDYGHTRLAPAEYGGRLRYVLLACVGLAGAVWLLAIVAP